MSVRDGGGEGERRDEGKKREREEQGRGEEDRERARVEDHINDCTDYGIVYWIRKQN